VNIHKNARLTPATRLEVVRRAQRAHANQSAVARAYHISRQTLRKWIGRYDAEGTAGLQDRPSTPRRCPNRLHRVRRRQIERRRRWRWSSLRIARDLQVPIATVVREQRRLGLHQLARLDPPRPANRYEWPHAGDLVHLDIKRLGRFARVGPRIHGDRTRRTSRIGWEYVHVAVDDATRLAYVEVLDEQGRESASAFVQRTLLALARRGITVHRVMTDNGSCYRARTFRASLAAAGIRQLFTKPYTPRTNGKAERFIRTLLAEWAYAQAYRSSAARALALSHYLGYYNSARPHMGIKGLTPRQKLAAIL
jgi:transposase InsO family protein